MNITTRYLTHNPCFKAGRTINVKGLMLHSVGCPQPNPDVFIKSWDRDSYDSACVHGFIGADDVFITLPCMETAGKAMRGWHGGGASNNTHLGFEMTEPGCIKYTGGANFTCTDRAAAISFVGRTTKNAVALFAVLCAYHGLNPLTDIISHAEGHALGIASNHGDPEHLWAGLGMDYGMDDFRRDVASAMKKEDSMDIKEVRAQLTSCVGTGDKASDWAKEATDWCRRKGIFNGNGNGDFGWQQPITREAVAQIIFNAFESAGMLEKLPDAR